MSAERFLDTNILIYAFAKDDPRAERATAILAAGGQISVQVLNEFTNVMRRKLSRDWAEIREALEIVKVLVAPPLVLSVQTHETAMALASRHHFAFYDALIVASALEANCKTLLSEDLQHGLDIRGLTIENPFAS